MNWQETVILPAHCFECASPSPSCTCVNCYGYELLQERRQQAKPAWEAGYDRRSEELEARLKQVEAVIADLKEQCKAGEKQGIVEVVEFINANIKMHSYVHISLVEWKAFLKKNGLEVK